MKNQTKEVLAEDYAPKESRRIDSSKEITYQRIKP